MYEKSSYPPPPRYPNARVPLFHVHRGRMKIRVKRRVSNGITSVSPPPTSPSAASATAALMAQFGLSPGDLRTVTADLERMVWATDPTTWAEERLGDRLWSKQREINNALVTHRRVLVRSCHGVGKSYDVSLLVGWWLDIHPVGDAFVVTSAPTAAQVRSILWREIGRVHSRGHLQGRVNQTSWLMTPVDGKEELVAFGRKPDEYDPAAFQGIHALRVLVIFDEANGIRGPLWEAADSLIANDFSKFICIGNPDDPEGEFFELSKPGSGWHVVEISAFDSPNFTNEPMPDRVLQQLIGRTYVEEKRRKWAPNWQWTPDQSRCLPPPGADPTDTNPFWQSKILGKFPESLATGSLIPMAWVRAAQDRTLTPLPTDPIELGLDVGASEGGDPSCCGHRHGPVFRVLYEERQPDTMRTTGRLIQTLHTPALGATLAKVDYIGVGRGVVDRCREQGLPVHPISVGEAGTVTMCRLCKHEWDQNLLPTPRCPKCGSDITLKVFANLLSQLWWGVRGVFEQGLIDIDPEDEDLAAELLTITWEPNSKGQTQVRYGSGPSPNRADALLITFAPVPVTLHENFVVW